MEKVAMAALLDGRLVSACGPDSGPGVGAADEDALSDTDDAPAMIASSRSITRFSSPQLLSFDQCSLVGGEKFKRERNGRRETRAQGFIRRDEGVVGSWVVYI